MNLHQMEILASHRARELRMTAHVCGGSASREPRRAWRRRLGWTLVEIGLRLVAKAPLPGLRPPRAQISAAGSVHG